MDERKKCKENTGENDSAVEEVVKLTLKKKNIVEHKSQFNIECARFKHE